MENVILSNGLKNIKNYAFSYCSSLKNITIPQSVTNIKNLAFSGCSNLKTITFENTEGWFIAYSSDATTGTSIDVTNASTNATNLVTTYRSLYWKRTE